MGGNAIPNARRIDPTEFKQISAEACAGVRQITGSYPKVVASYRNKPSFGDIDFIVTEKVTPQELLEIFGNPVNKVNSNVVSLEYKGVQLDFIITPYLEHEAALNYFAYNDLGNLMGRIAHKMGFKLGHRGLMYVVRNADGDQVIDEILVSNKYHTILPFLGYNYAEWEQGFDDLEDIYRFAASSPYFSKAIFQLDNRNHASRVRDRKRATYTGFLEWMETQPLCEVREYDKPQYLLEAFYLWGDFEYSYDQAVRNSLFRQSFKKVFNGHLVTDLTELKGKELGGFMSDFTAKYPPAMIAIMGEEELHKRILSYYFGRFDSKVQ